MIRDDLVSVAGREGPFKNIKQALSQLDLNCLKGKRVLIKPNIGRPASPAKGYNTHPQAIAAVLDTMREIGVSDLAVGESPLVGINTFEAFDKGGVTEVVKKYDAQLIDFDATPPVIKEIMEGRVLCDTKICSAVYDYDYLVSVPVAKMHMHTGVTLGIKNMKGCLYRHEKVKYHQLEYLDKEYPEKTLDSAISDLATVLLPDLTIIDGYIGMEGLGPSGGNAIKSDFAVASRHPMGADIFACLLMGLDPSEVTYLRLISERMNMSVNPADYHVLPGDFSKYIVKYKRPPTNISVEYPEIKVYEREACSACLSTLMLFLRRFKDDMTQYVLHDGKFHIAIGKGVGDSPEGTVFVGNCTRFMKDKGTFVKGCPPVPTRIYEAIRGYEPDRNEPEVE